MITHTTDINEHYELLEEVKKLTVEVEKTRKALLNHKAEAHTIVQECNRLKVKNERLLNFIGGLVSYSGFVFKEDEQTATSLIINP
jgi:hypothetical protein